MRATRDLPTAAATPPTGRFARTDCAGATEESPEQLAEPLLRLLDDHGNRAALGRHCEAVGDLAVVIGRRLGLPDDTLRQLYLAGVLHDIGKAMVPDSVLEKPGPLSTVEWEEIRRHPETGYLLIRSVGLDEIAEWVRAHHERPDGFGYPFGSRKRPLGGAIVSVADGYHAMTAERTYREAMSPEEARAEMLRCSGSQFEPEIVEALLAGLDGC
jgi:HD-GYP domain-containing protein (c-di-GMP phosphodiesterase class II)